MNRLLSVGLALVLAAGVWWWLAREDRLVVYCAHDSVFSEQILRNFEKESGIPVAIRFDTEATKSLGLVELILRERAAPRCDVFWNNEPLGMMEIAQAGALEPYQGSGWQRMPEEFRDPAGLWTGFAARMRVIIRNTDATQGFEPFFQRVKNGSLDRVAMAKPLYGTTRFHYTALWREDAAALRARDRDWRARGLRIVSGNAAVKDSVAAGACDYGFTDTDDFFEARDAGKPVAMTPATIPLEGGAAILIPNTVGIIRGTSRRSQAEALVDYLLSARVELALARSGSRQIPLGPVEPDELPPEVRDLAEKSRRHVPLTALDAARKECLAWLKQDE